MTGPSEFAVDPDAARIETLPAALGGGMTVLVAGTVDPARHAVGLRALRRYGGDGDSAVVVTTTQGADATSDAYAAVGPDDSGPSLALVDATAGQQYVTARYDETPTASVPAPGDLERLVVALSELTATGPPSGGTRHLVVRSLTPVLRRAPTDRVCAVLDRILGLRAGDGIGVLGLDYTAHDEGTMAKLAGRVDGVLWVERRPDDRLALEFDPTRSRGRGRGRPSARGSEGDG